VIRDNKNGEFSIHKSYFESLKTVNPTIKNAALIPEIVAMQISAVNHFKVALNRCAESNEFSKDELKYINSVYSQFTSGCLAVIDEVIAIITNDAFAMTDDERIKHIHDLYSDMKEKSQFVLSFTNDGNLLALQRVKEKNDIIVSKSLHDIK
jgi:hypothetical protein